MNIKTDRLYRAIKKMIFIFILFVALFVKAEMTYAKPPDFHGGVLNEYMYEEISFLTGYPVKFSGKAVVTEKENKDKLTTTYRFTLTSVAGDKLTRSVSYEADLTKHEDKGQITSKSTVKSYSETITMFKGEVYKLDDYQFSQGIITDNRPATDFYSGNIIGRKIYKTKLNTLITIQMSGKNMGYKNFWGATETQLMDYEIISGRDSSFITSKVSDSKSRTLTYEPHDPDLSSFKGGYVVTSTSNMVGAYTYNIPDQNGNRTGTIEIAQENVPIVERLIVPKFRDLAKHWAREEIESLYSLGILDEDSQFFSPNTPLNRYQYTVGILKAVDLRVAEVPKNTSKKTPPRKPIFKDLDIKEKDYLYIESGVEKGLIAGVGSNMFMPNSSITRAQAAVILVRALGMEGRAPDPGYHTGFKDDKAIPNWSKDSVYIANELGLIYGDDLNRFNPNKPLTRAEGSALIVRFLDFLEHDLKENYREDMMFLN